ncbi:phage holin family protein [Rhodoferax sp. UBA5149]|uniref:phage holin family protein n=1 Tax=Rhodoferax sp. UBA5149 TaxID=1947379 RepID=UPI0025CC3A96|nr:phage holin family protein [Rhodoferax sp. UBA5149]
MLATVLEMAQVRLDILGTDAELEKRRFFDGLLWGAVALMVLGVGLVLLCGFVILLFGDAHRLPALGVMALLFLVLGVLLIREARQRLSNPSGMFKASLAELERDRAGLQASGQHEQR